MADRTVRRVLVVLGVAVLLIIGYSVWVGNRLSLWPLSLRGDSLRVTRLGGAHWTETIPKGASVQAVGKALVSMTAPPTEPGTNVGICTPGKATSYRLTFLHGANASLTAQVAGCLPTWDQQYAIITLTAEGQTHRMDAGFATLLARALALPEVALFPSGSPASVSPQFAAFWNGRTGLLAGSSPASNLWTLVTLAQDGKAPVRSLALQEFSPLALGTSAYHSAWIAFTGGCGSVSCEIQLLRTRNGGFSWTLAPRFEAGVVPQGFVGNFGWSVTTLRPQGPLAKLKLTDDGGVRWRTLAGACPADRPEPTAASFTSDADGYLVCAAQGRPGAALRHSGDGGQTWTDIASVELGSPSGMAMLTDGRGWIWSGRKLTVTTDGGRTWRAAPLPSGGGKILSASLAPEAGYLLMETANPTGTTLWRTADLGAHWTAAAAWSSLAASPSRPERTVSDAPSGETPEPASLRHRS